MNRRAAAALALALPIALTACSAGDAPETIEVTSTVTETPAEDDGATEAQSTASQSETTAEATTASTQAETYEDLDPELFNLGGAYVVGGADTGVAGCMAKPGTNYPFNCQISFTYPVPPVEDLGGAGTAIAPNVASWKDGRFITAFSPGSQGYMTPPRPLEQGQRVTIDGATLTHLVDGGFRVEYNGDAFEVHDGVYARDGEVDQALAVAAKPVSRGTQCGSTFTPSLQDVAIVASEDGTTCGTAARVMRDYVHALIDGQTEGQAALWTAPNGWSCTGRWFFTGEENVGANGKMACAAKSLQGAPVEGHGSGEVVALTAEDRTRL
ncbi:hypothetical protein [Corynebacterium jeddahense]|uniref:Secreted protein n=1 Tax=Corynebacterium jeddahense TaxID=1414719 RepID=A0ABY7UJ65_9CORY|nr:hypothetical protein [Corynebacterium jeddahense]WCZ38642.1 hypothetical protein CJEDD_05155 [Corynebacterium jeddahense]